MNQELFKDVVAPRNQLLWILLAIQSGFMNAGGLLACHQFVSHMTGYGSNVGVAFANRQYMGALEMAMAPLFFLAGAIFAGWLVDRRMIRSEAPRIEAGIIILAALNMFIYTGEFSGYLGTFGEPLVLQRDFLLLFVLCFACGLQNGLFTGVTQGKIRTTHLTGPITDIGLNISRILTLGKDDPNRKRESTMNWLRVKIVGSFSLGSMIAALFFTKLSYEGFLVPCAISLFLVWYVRFLLNQYRAGHAATALAQHAAAHATPAESGRRNLEGASL